MSTPARNRERQRADLSTYFITFVCYGAWLPGQPGAVDRQHNAYGSPWPEPDQARQESACRRMAQPPYRLDQARRQIVLDTIRRVCDWRGWSLLAAHVRTTHVHLVVQAWHTPEQVMTSLKAYASRALDASGLDEPGRRRWARHGSTKYLWTRDQVAAVVRYVQSGQGDPMALFVEAAR